MDDRFVLFAQSLFPFMNIILYIFKKGAYCPLKKGQIRLLFRRELKRESFEIVLQSKVTGKGWKKKKKGSRI